MKRILAAVALASAPPAAHAQLLTTGTGGFVAPSAGGGLSAVHFDRIKSALYTTSPLANASGPVADTPVMTVSYVIRGVPNTAAQSNGGRSLTSGFVDLVSAIEAGSQGSETVPGQNTVFDTAQGDGTLRFNLATAAGAQCQYLINPGNVPPPQRSDWNVITYTFDGSGTSSSGKAMAVALNGVEIGEGGCNSTGGSAAFLAGVSNANGWLVANLNANTGQATFDIAEVFVDFSHTMATATNHFIAGGLAKFVDGNGAPVDLGDHCEKVFGSPPDICFRGPAATFATNKGTVTNAFTASGIFPASYGPGPAAAHAVQFVGTYGEGVTPSATTFTTIDTGMSILAGDLIIQGVELTDTQVSVDHAPPCPTGYGLITRIAATGNTATTGALCSRRATTDGESTAVTWPTWIGAPGDGGFWFTSVVRGADATTPIEDSAASMNGASGNTTAWTAPSVTAASPNDLLVNYLLGWAADDFTVPAGQTRERSFGGSSGGRNTVVINFEPLSGSGATGTRSYTSNLADGGAAFSLVIKPK
jgi:hypothetical protein